MNEEGFRAFLKEQGRSQGTMEQCVRLMGEFEAYLGEHRAGQGLDEAHPEDLEAFVSWKKKQRKSVHSYLWATHRYYEYTSNEPMRRLATDMRQQEIAKGRGRRMSLRLKDIQRVAAEQTEKLAAIGIAEVNEQRQILKRHPTLVETRYWVTQAKALQKVVEY